MREIRNSSGFSIIEVLIAAAMMSILAMGMTSIFQMMNASNNDLKANVGAQSLRSSLIMTISNPATCALRLDASTRAFGSAQQAAAVGSGLELAFTMEDGSSIVRAGAALPRFDVTVNSLRFVATAPLTTLGPDPAAAGNQLYAGALLLGYQKLAFNQAVSGGRALRDVTIGGIILSVNAAGTITGCSSAGNASTTCSDLGGSYDPSWTPPCHLPFPCGSGQAFLGYSGAAAVCRQFTSSCPSGYVLTSDGAGGVTCMPNGGVAAVPTAAPTAAPVPTAVPTAAPTPAPTAAPTATPTPTPIVVATATPVGATCGGVPKPTTAGPVPNCTKGWRSCGGKHWICQNGAWEWEILDVCGGVCP